MNSAGKKKVFEKITESQIWKIESLVNQSQKFDTEKLYSMINDLTGISSIHSLSKQEASFVIDKLLGIDHWPRPLPPRTAEAIKKDAGNLPSYGHIFGIRELVRTLEWDREHFTAWLKKYIKAGNLDELTRETARKAYIGLTKIRIRDLES